MFFKIIQFSKRIKIILLFANEFLHHLRIKKHFVYIFLNNIRRRIHKKDLKSELVQQSNNEVELLCKI